MNSNPQKPQECPRCCPFPRGNIPRIRSAGYFYRSNQKAKVARFFCLNCRKGFSQSTFTPEYRQRKRHINHPLYELLSSSISMRRAAIVLQIARRTVERRLQYLGRVAEYQHQNFIKTKKAIIHAHFDDMESWIHTKLKPVSIPLAIEHPTRLIIAFDVVSMPCKGRLTHASLAKYGPRLDERAIGWKRVLRRLNSVADKEIIITSDSHPMYPKQIRSHIPFARHTKVLSRKACVVGQGELKRGGWDPIFSLNHTAAMFRANINRLARKTWCTSKKPENLRCHMQIFTMWHNETILAKKEGRERMSPFAALI